MSFIHAPNGEKALPVKINGTAEPIDAARLFAVESSITGHTVHHAQSATPELAVKAVEAARAAFKEWSGTTYAFRRDILLRVADLIEAREERFKELQKTETSCPEAWAWFNVHASAKTFREIAAYIPHVMTGELPPTQTKGATCLVFKVPVGPVFAISPWNVSVLAASHVLANALAAGCTVVFKASELSPAVHHYLIETLEDAGLPRGVVNVIQAARADAPAVCEAVIGHPAIRKVAFTGSETVGRIIGQLASKYLKPVLMELGGNAPVIVLKDADAKLAARLIASGALLYHGQTCMATDRVIVVKDVADELIKELRAVIKQDYPNGVGHAVTRAHAQRASALLHKAHANGAKFLIGDASLDATGSSLTPTVIGSVKPTDDLYHEEVFGPAAIFIVVEDEDEAVRVANDSRFGLNAAVHSRDVLAAMRVAQQVEAGQVHIGSMTTFGESTTPFGGIKNSGWGRINGKFGIEEFVTQKVISLHDPATAAGPNRFQKQ